MRLHLLERFYPQKIETVCQNLGCRRSQAEAEISTVTPENTMLGIKQIERLGKLEKIGAEVTRCKVACGFGDDIRKI